MGYNFESMRHFTVTSHYCKTGIAALLTAAALVAIGCGGPKEVVIGGLVPLTGDAATYGDVIKQGMEIARRHVNANGGVNKRDVRLVFRDSKGDPAVGVEEARALIREDKAMFVVSFEAPVGAPRDEAVNMVNGNRTLPVPGPRRSFCRAWRKGWSPRSGRR